MSVPERPEVREALQALAKAEEKTLTVRYAELWLQEAARARDAADERRRLDEAAGQLGKAMLASAGPSAELRRAFMLTVEAYREATD